MLTLTIVTLARRFWMFESDPPINPGKDYKDQ
jgi:hypothetical protein